MTLPLFTMALLRKGWGEASIGRIYAANTLGAILGVALAVHVLIPLLGLRLAVTLAAVVDILLGVLLLKVYAADVTPRPFRFAVLASVAVLGGSLVLGQLDPRALASGVFRHGQPSLSDSARIEFFRDGKTASVAVVASGTTNAIVTNGKSDAALQMDPDAPPSADETTMAMLAILPLAAHPSPRDIAVIGWGSGMSTDLLLASAAPRRVETIEIERAMHEGARLFGSRVARAYEDPRSHVVFDDARTYFSTGRKRYDVIVSEPSNPWVSGVGSLFTREFYRLLRGHLQPSGLVVQWLHSYELDDPLLMTMLAALLSEFPHVEAYASHGTDIILLAGMAPIGELDLSRLADEPMAGELRRLGLAEPGDLAARKVGNQDTLAALVSLYATEPHSDFHPLVALHAPRARFIGSRAVGLDNVASAGLPLLELTGGRRPVRDEDVVSPLIGRRGATDYWNALYLREALLDNWSGRLQEASPDAVAHVRFLKSTEDAPVSGEQLFDWLTAASVAAEFSIAFLRPVDQSGLWVDPTWVHGQGQPEVVQRVLAAYAAAALRSPDMREKGLSALALLDERDPAITREHMLVIALLGAAAQGDFEAVQQIEATHGARVPAEGYRMGRAFLQSWARLGGQS
jgi:spermidine synthase